MSPNKMLRKRKCWCVETGKNPHSKLVLGCKYTTRRQREELDAPAVAHSQVLHT